MDGQGKRWRSAAPSVGSPPLVPLCHAPKPHQAPGGQGRPNTIASSPPSTAPPAQGICSHFLNGRTTTGPWSLKEHFVLWNPWLSMFRKSRADRLILQEWQGRINLWTESRWMGRGIQQFLHRAVVLAEINPKSNFFQYTFWHPQTIKPIGDSKFF